MVKQHAASYLPLLFAVAALLFTAGCIGAPPLPSPAVDSVPVDISDEFQAALNAFISDMGQLEKEIVTDLTSLANDMGQAKTPEAMEEAARAYYAENPWVISVAYYDFINDSIWDVPIAAPASVSAYIVPPTEEDFEKSDGFIIQNGIFFDEHGYLNLFFRPVYDSEGSYCGALIFVVDPYLITNMHPFMMNKNLSYTDYLGFVADSSGKIIYSSVGEAHGVHIPEGEGYYDSQFYLPDPAADSGACKYTSRAFYNYDSRQTEKITAWQRLTSSVSGSSVFYLVQEIDHPEAKTEDVYTLYTGQAINDTRDAFRYVYSDGKLDLSYRIKSGYYSTPIRIMSMKGTIISADNPDIEGLNLMNRRGAYGMPYTLASIFAAEQGGGYVYFMRPVEPVIRPQFAAYSLALIYSLDNTCFTSVQFPGDEDVVSIDYVLRSDVTRVSRAVMYEAVESGVDAVAAKINAGREAGPEMFVGNVSPEIQDIAIMDIYGNVYASIVYPERVGKVATDMTDVYGGSTTRRALMMAKTGTGVLSVLKPSFGKEGYVDMWMAAIEPIDGMYYVSTAAYLGTFEDVLAPYLRDKT